MVKHRRIIGLYASQPQSGKSTAAAALVEQGWVIVPFAGTLKRMTRALLWDLGYSHTRIDALLSSEKELPLKELDGITPRRMMQTLGTDWGRECVHPEVWLKAWEAQVQSLPSAVGVVVDDVRFSNEARLITDLGGRMMRVKRDVQTADDVLAHASEGGLNDWPFDAWLLNDGTAAELQQRMVRMAVLLFDS